MSDENTGTGLSRRRYVKLFGGTASVMTIAGCGGDGGDGGGDGDGGDGDGGDGDGGGDGGDGDGGTTTLEIQHWWTDGADGTAMQTLQDEFLSRHDNIEINDNPIAGGAGQNLQAVIRQKVLEGDPPSTWQDWPGANLKDYVEADALKDIGYVFEGDIEENYRDGPLLSARAGSSDNPYVAMPLNIHRVNNFFYDVELTEEAGVSWDVEGPRELNEVLAQVDDALDQAAFAVAMQAPWTVLQLWASNFIGVGDADAYMSFRNGEGDIDLIQEALEITLEQFDYVTDDARSIGNDQAAAKLPEGNAVAAMEGDWMAGNLLEAEGYDFGDHWGHNPWPGSEEVYVINTDGFPYPKPNPTTDATDKWMQWVGSADAHRMFNPIKGSIPCRSDVDVSEFNAFLQRQFEDFNNTTGVLTVTHGDGATPQQGTSLKNAISRFMDNENVESTAAALRDAMTL
jgi:glucose/mannose transport system substrate-binding protein